MASVVKSLFSVRAESFFEAEYSSLVLFLDPFMTAIVSRWIYRFADHLRYPHSSGYLKYRVDYNNGYSFQALSETFISFENALKFIAVLNFFV